MEKKPERITIFKPAFDKRNPDPHKNYGSAVQVFMVLKGPDIAVHFTFSTGIYLPETMEEYHRSGKLSPWAHSDGKHRFFNDPMGYDVGYHDAIAPHFESQTSHNGCDWLDGRACYGDGSAMRAEQWMDILIREGSDKIWQMLEEYYKEIAEERIK